MHLPLVSITWVSTAVFWVTVRRRGGAEEGRSDLRGGKRMDGREQVLNILEVLGRTASGLENADYPGLSSVSEELKEALTRLDELKNKLFMRSKKSLNFTYPLWEAAVNLENSLNSTGQTAGGKGIGEKELLRLLEDFKSKMETLEKAVKSHSVIIT